MLRLCFALMGDKSVTVDAFHTSVPGITPVETALLLNENYSIVQYSIPS